jgi:predicted O-methyltransferase YrrM
MRHSSLLRRGFRKLQRLTGTGDPFPGEIKDDAFYHCIERLARESGVRTILEIGSSAGGGSTEAFVKGIRQNPARPTLFCMEVARDRFERLQARYPEPFVKCYNVSSVPADSFPTEREVTDFLKIVPLKRRTEELSRTYLGWRQAELDYLRSSGVPDDGIELIKRENGIQHFDMVLIDGSEFTGPPEYDRIIGARYVLLDDILVLKNRYNSLRLLADRRYTMIECDTTLRNGYAVFRLK